MVAVRYSENRLRESTGAQGFPVTHAQFHNFLDTGLIPQPGKDKKWEPCVVDMLLAIRALGETVRPLPRRVIHFYGDPLFPHIRWEQVYTAALETGRGITDPKDKMRAVNTAMQHIAPFDEMFSNDEMPRETADRQSQQPPTHEEWLGALRLGQEVFPSRLNEWREWARYLHEAGLSAKREPILYEELVILSAGWYLFYLLKISARQVGMESMPEVVGRILLENTRTETVREILPEKTPAEFARRLSEVARKNLSEKTPAEFARILSEEAA